MPELLAPSGSVRVHGHLDPELNRWRWLVKWLLVLPHVLVLAVLWVAVIVLTVVAGVSIAVTGRYPRAIFDFNLGVLRWTWRVQFYAFTLGTDRYPPFSLEAEPDYPARLDIDYPERLSRGLVWIKWWLLALPHYLVIAAFSGGAAPRFGGGLISLLALVAGVTLLVTQRYPEPIFQFVMGMHRWVWRVVAYTSLMRDEYPPFRLDTGPDEPEAGPSPPVPSTPPTPPARPAQPGPAVA
jgi:hypothetical protein